jgi:hypothetical protein
MVTDNALDIIIMSLHIMKDFSTQHKMSLSDMCNYIILYIIHTNFIQLLPVKYNVQERKHT